MSPLNRKRILLVIAFLFAAACVSVENYASAGTNAQTFSYQGQLMDGSGQNPLTGVISMTIGIYDSSDTCLLYEENQSQDVTNTNGFFSIEVGSFSLNAKRTARDPQLSMAQVFSNSSVIAGFGCTYTPVGGDPRRIRLTLSSTELGTVTLTPDQYLSVTPQALVAETLQGMGPSSFIQASGTVTQSSLSTLTNNSDASSFSLHHHDSRYVTIGSATNVNLGTATTFTTGQMGIGTTTPVARLEIDTGGPGQVAQTIKGFAGQTSNLFEIRDSANGILSFFDSVGRLVLNSAPSGPNDATNKNYVDTRLTTQQAAIDSKEPLITAGGISQYYRGDKTFQSLNTSVVAESGPNQYYTDARAQASIHVSGGLLSINTGTISLGIGNIPLAGSGPLTYGISGGTGYFALSAPAGQMLIGNAIGNVTPIAMNGDGTLNSSGTFVLSSSVSPGVTAGTYSRVSVNSRGVVVAGTGLAPIDVAGALAGDVVGGSTGNTVQKISGMAVASTGTYSPTGVTGLTGAGSVFLGWNGGPGRWEPMGARGPLSCPGGTMVGNSGQAGTFCISSPTSAGSWGSAISSCMATQGAHLCLPSEWMTACMAGVITAGTEWVFQPVAGGNNALVLTPGIGCTGIGFSIGIAGINSPSTNYRCCSN